MYISYFALAQFIVVVIYLNIAILTLSKSSKETLNKVFFLLMLSLIWWGTTGMFRLLNVSEEVAVFLTQLGSLGWTLFPSFFIWFVFIFIEKPVLTKKVFYPLIFFLPLILMVAECLTPFRIPAENNTYLWVNSFWTYLYIVYYSSFFLVGIYSLYRYYQKTKIKLRQQQAMLIIFCTLFSLILGTIIEFFPSQMMFASVLSTGNIFLILWALGMFYVIAKYKLFTPSFTMASENIVNNMTESLLLLDNKGKIVDINNQAASFLQSSREGIIGQNLAEYFSGEATDKINKMVQEKTSLESTDFNIKIKKGLVSAVLFSGYQVNGGKNDVLGWVCMMRDVSSQKKVEDLITAKNIELQEKLSESEKMQKIILERELKMIEMKNELKILAEKNI